MKKLIPLMLAALAVTAGAQESKKAEKAEAKTEAKAAKKTQAELRKEAKIEEKEARKTALGKVPNGKVREEELEEENGRLIYSYDIKVPGKPGIEEVNVDAKTGEVVSQTHESPADEKAEAKSEKAEKKADKKKP